MDDIAARLAQCCEVIGLASKMGPSVAVLCTILESMRASADRRLSVVSVSIDIATSDAILGILVIFFFFGFPKAKVL